MSEPVHLASPFGFNAKGNAKTVQQETTEHLATCAYNVAVCELGFRDDLVEFGITDQTFRTVPLNLELLKTQLERWCPPGTELTESEVGEVLNVAERRITVEVS